MISGTQTHKEDSRMDTENIMWGVATVVLLITAVVGMILLFKEDKGGKP